MNGVVCFIGWATIIVAATFGYVAVLFAVDDWHMRARERRRSR